MDRSKTIFNAIDIIVIIGHVTQKIKTFIFS